MSLETCALGPRSDLAVDDGVHPAAGKVAAQRCPSRGMVPQHGSYCPGYGGPQAACAPIELAEALGDTL